MIHLIKEEKRCIMPEIGERVLVHYDGTLDDGTQFDSSRDRGEPLDFVLGTHAVLPLFERTVSELQVGERKSIRIAPAQAYGEYDESLVLKAPKNAFAGAPSLDVGTKLKIMTKVGPVDARIVDSDDKVVTFDCNHELAGKALNFDIELVAVKHEAAIEREMHGEGCACGCHKLKESLEASQSA